MTHARVARPSSAASITPARVLGGLLLGGALVFSAGQAVQAAGPAPSKAASAPAPACDDGACPWHGGEQGRKGDHKGERKGEHPGHDMKGGSGMGLPFAGPGFERVLDDIKATDAQRKQIQGITAKAHADLRALHDKARDQRQDAMAIWTAPKIDAAEAEKQRQQMLAQHDQVSKRVMQAMLDVGQVLTPEQRAKAAESLKQRRERMHEHMQERMEDRKERREEAHGAREGGEERLQNHKLRRPAPPASAPAPASQSAPSR